MQVVLAPLTRTRTKKRTPSQQRRSQRRLNDFIRTKSLEHATIATEPLNKASQENQVCTVAKHSVNMAASGRVKSSLGTSSPPDPVPQAADRRPLQEKSPTLCIISNSVDSALTQPQQPNSKHISTTQPTVHETPNSKVVLVKTSANTKSLDLTTCFSKQFEEGDKGVPGVRYTSPTGISCWTPVFKGSIPPSVSIPYNIATTSLEDLIGRAKDVSYYEIDHHPGLKIRTGSTSRNITWIPIVTYESPISHRTRSHTVTKRT